MATSDEQLIEDLKASMAQGGLATSFGDDAQQSPFDGDFMQAMNAFRVARASGDRQALEEAEARLRAVVRGELTGEGCA